MNHMKGKGACLQWLKDRVAYNGDGCLAWPFCLDRQTGYGSLGVNGERKRAHRVMCELVNGPPPTPKHHAAHTCNKGHLSCVDPRHLVWKTPGENSLDRRAAGTVPANPLGRFSRLSVHQVRDIILARGRKTQRQVADEFGISTKYVCNIQLGQTPLSQKAMALIPEHQSKTEGA